MKHPILVPKIISFLVSAIASCTSAFAHDVTVEIHTEKVHYRLGEPVLVSATVVNGSEAPVKLIHHNAPTLSERTFSIVDLRLGSTPDQMERWGDDLRDRLATVPRTIQPREKIEVDLIMLYNNRQKGFFAASPGRYYIAGRIVVVANPYVEIISSPVAIDIVQPSSDVDRTNWQWLDANKEEYGRMVQVPWSADLSDSFLREAGRRCETSQSIYSEYLGLFLSRAYREGPKKDADLSSRFAQIAKERATSDKLRSEAEKLLRSPRVEPHAPASAPAVARAVDDATQRAVAEVLDKLSAAITGGRLEECATLLSDDFLRNGFTDKASMLSILKDDLVEHQGSVVSFIVDSVSGGAASSEVEVLGRQVAKVPGRATEERHVKWTLRREGSNWLILRRDDREPRAAGQP